MTEPSQYFKGRTVQEQMNEVIGYVDVRSAEVATTAIAADVAQVHQDMLDADADASAAAASAAAAAGTLANAVKKTGEASQSIAGNIEVSGTLKSAGTLYATGDASVGGNLGVGGSTNVGDLTATGNVTVPTVATGTFDTKAVNGTKLKNELDAYTPMMRLANNQPYTGVKELQKLSTSLPSMIRVTDAISTSYPDTIYLSGIRDGDNNWILNDKVGTDNNGSRGFYQKQYRLHTTDADYVVSVRLNVTSTGIQLQVLDPVNNVWKNVVLQ